MKLNIERIKYEMTRKGWNTIELARQTGWKKQWASYLLTKKGVGFQFKTIERLAEVFGINPKDLII